MSNPTELQGGVNYINKADLNHKTNEISDFCQANNITSQELFTAYQIALGVTESAAPRPEISQLATLLDTNFKNGYPLNRITALVDTMAEIEAKISQEKSAADKAKEFGIKLGELGISDKEKALLTNIANRRRVGKLCIYTKNGDREILNLPITGTPFPQDSFSQQAADRIIEILHLAQDRAAGKGISIILES